MSTPSGDQPTRVLPSTAEQPAATTTAPSPATFWRQRVPAHLGRARTSTVVLAVLFVVFFGLYLAVRPDYVTVTTVDGDTVRVDRSQLSTPTTPTDPALPTEPIGPTTEASGTTEPGEPTDTTGPEATTSQQTPPTTTTPDEEESTAPTTSPDSTTRAPATTRETTPPPETEGTPAPTG